MKNMNLMYAFLGGAAAGALIGILFAPDKGTDTRAQIAEYLREKGIHFHHNHAIEDLVDEIADQIKTKAAK